MYSSYPSARSSRGGSSKGSADICRHHRDHVLGELFWIEAG